MRTDIRLWVGMVVVAVLVLASAWSPWSSSATEANAEDGGFGGGYPAFLKAQKVIILSARVEGMIEAIAYRAQDFVEAGEVLISLDDKMARFDVQSADDKLAMNALATDQKVVSEEYAKETLEITRALYDKPIDGVRVVARKELKETEQMAAIADLQVRSSKLEGNLLGTNREQYRELLARHEVKAPVSGVLAPFSSVLQLRESNIKQPEVGETVRAGQVVAAMIKVDQLRVFQPLPLAQLDKVQLGQAARVYVEGGPPEGIDAEVIFKSPTLEVSDQFHIGVEFANPRIDGQESKRSWYRYRYRDGMRARVELVREK